MKKFKYLLIMSFVVFLMCSPALSAEDVNPYRDKQIETPCEVDIKVVDVNQYLNTDGTVNQTAIMAAIACGANPIALAVELAVARPDLAAEFVTAVGIAAPNVDMVALAAAVTKALPEKADAIQAAVTALAPNRAEEIAAAVFTAQTTTIQEYQQEKKNLSLSPST